LIALGLGLAVVGSLEIFIFGMVSESVILSLRKSIFSSLFRQDIGYFDEPCHSTGVLCSRLAGDPLLVHGKAN
jgi:ABC-type multidrug transport system fused ATPase/permease subunit